ncbi:hypothetical protein J1614_011100 [Plenodomus biglobosus]|nr:hypothetical protein J1614_011100 [Plenodomus biglobosus]
MTTSSSSSSQARVNAKPPALRLNLCALGDTDRFIDDHTALEPSVPHSGSTVLSVDNQFGGQGHHCQTSLPSLNSGFTLNDTNGASLPDGREEWTWYCSECGDGPRLLWQNTCFNCYHPRCSACRLEVAK